MLAQIDFYRQHALDSFPVILKGVSHDPAMMVYLNVDGSQRNGAERELRARAHGAVRAGRRQLHREGRARGGPRLHRLAGAARARRQPGPVHLKTPVFRPQRFDNGTKTFLGKTGNFGPDDIVDIIAEQPASAKYIVRRLFAFFVYPDPSDADLKPFIDAYMSNGKSIRSVVEAMLRSDVFYSPKAYRAIVKSPVEYAVGAIKAVNGQAATSAEANGGPAARQGRWLVGAMGQTIYEPPNVAGWPGNASWLNASTMFARLNFINAITGGGAQWPAQPQRPGAGRRPLPSRPRHGGAGPGALPAAGPGRQPDAGDAPGPHRLRRRRRSCSLRRSSCAASSTSILGSPQFHLS